MFLYYILLSLKEQIVWLAILFDAGQLFIANEVLYCGYGASDGNVLHRGFVRVILPGE